MWPETYSRVLNLIHGISLKEDFNGEISLVFLSLFCLAYQLPSHLNSLSQVTGFLGKFRKYMRSIYNITVTVIQVEFWARCGCIHLLSSGGSSVHV